MASLDHIILKVNDLKARVSFYTEVMGFTLEGVDGPFTVLKVGPQYVARSRVGRARDRYHSLFQRPQPAPDRD
jgi:catechol 2,3-dioxygenase-like lactoylglutathione lyase family enzyme